MNNIVQFHNFMNSKWREGEFEPKAPSQGTLLVESYLFNKDLMTIHGEL
jgi:hypothetical protein